MNETDPGTIYNKAQQVKKNIDGQVIRQVVNEPNVYPDYLNHFIWR